MSEKRTDPKTVLDALLASLEKAPAYNANVHGQWGRIYT